MTSLIASVRVDCHFHVFEAGQAVTGARYVPAYKATIESWAKQADGVGVSHGVLIQPSFLGVDNHKLLSTLAAYPDKLKGVVVVSPAISRSELLAMHVAGVRGVRLNFSGRDHDLQAWAQQRTFWDGVLSLGWHVQVHTDPGRLPDVLPSLPSGLHIVVDHMGRPLNCSPSDPTLSLLRRLGPDRVSVKLSGAYRLGRVKPQALAQSLLAELGPEALLWGSDWPCTNFETWADYPALYAGLSQWLGDQHVEVVLRANPLRLYWGTGLDV